MNLVRQIKAGTLVFGDLLALYAGLLTTLLLRTHAPENFYDQFVRYHLLPFSVVFVLWLVVFYIAGLYDFHRLRNNFSFFKTLSLALLVNAILAIVFFYSAPFVDIAPKTNFIVFLGIFVVLEITWRPFFNRLLARSESLINVFLVGNSQATQTVADFVKKNPQFGYAITKQEKIWDERLTGNAMLSQVEQNRIGVVVVSRPLKQNTAAANILYALIDKGVRVIDVPAFYEALMRKIPLEEIESGWFLDHLDNQIDLYDHIKQLAEFFGAVLLQILLVPLEAVIALLIFVTSSGPVIYRQMRAGKDGKPFTLYKFRTMGKNAENAGPQWSQAGDTRVTPLGKLLRHTHLDELPQLINIIKGELSFVGPRPERPEFIATLKQQIPYYDIRTIVRPGITGWAQVCYKYGASIEDTREKLQYDIYYLKNRSAILDLVILLKTLKMFFVSPHTTSR